MPNGIVVCSTIAPGVTRTDPPSTAAHPAKWDTVSPSGTMADMSDLSNDEPLLNLDQGYRAAYDFIRQFYERDSRKPESMFNLLSWMQLQGSRVSADPAQWHDLVTSVSRSVELGEEELLSEPLSQPVSK
jgi:hypothetical protein